MDTAALAAALSQAAQVNRPPKAARSHVMGSSIRKLRSSWRALPAIAIAAIAVACGGGYGSSTASYGTATAPPAGVSVGAITGFGSVHLNGRKFETTSATISVNGSPATQAQLQVGDVIEVKGHHDAASGKDIADQIEMHSNVQGPVSAIDTAAPGITVLGQKVLVSATTSFGGGNPAITLATLKVGDIVEVSGMVATNGDIQATRIELQAANAPLRVIGTAAATDSSARTLKINALTVDFSAATLADFASGGPKDGDLVEARGTTLSATGALMATRLENHTGKGLKADANGDSEVEGLITRFASASDFDVNGHAVATSSSTTYSGGVVGDLALNVHVEVAGSANAAGVIQATKVEFEHEPNAHVLAQVDAVDASAGTVKVLGITFTINAMTRFEDKSPAKVGNFSLADLHTQDWIDVRGATASSGIAATRLERRNPASAVQLSGAVDSATEPNLTVLGVKVATTATTQFKGTGGGTVTSTVFFTSLAGHAASVSGSWDGTTLAAAMAALGEDHSAD
jgi:hypothetical protein